MSYVSMFMLVSTVVTLPLLIYGTKRQLGRVTVGDVLACIIGSMLPFFNIMVVLFLYEVLDKALNKEVF